MKRIFKGLGQALLSFLVVCILSLGIYCLAIESYKAGVKVESQKTRVQTIAILNLSAENEELQSTIITLDGNNATLRILVQTKQEEIDNLKSTVTSLNSSLTSLKNDKEATDKVVEQLENDVDYLNNYVSQLESELNEFKQSVTVIYLPKEFATATLVYHIKTNDDTLLLSTEKKSIGLWKYKVSTQSVEQILSQGYQYTEQLQVTNKISLISSYQFGGVVKYNAEDDSCIELLPYVSNYKYYFYNYSEYSRILIWNYGTVYCYDYFIDNLTKFDNSAMLGTCLLTKDNYLYFEYDYFVTYGLCKVDILNCTTENIAGGLFDNYCQISDTQIISIGFNSSATTYAGMWLFDVTDESMIQLTSDNVRRSDPYLKDNLLYYTTDGCLNCLNLDTLETTSLELACVYIREGYRYLNYFELENGFLVSCSYSSSTYYGLYYVLYDLSSYITLLTNGYNWTTIINYSNGYLISSTASVNGLYYLDKTTLEIAQIYSYGACYNSMIDLDEKVLLFNTTYKISNSYAYVILLDKETSEVAKVTSQTYGINVVYEDENYVFLLTYNRLYKISKSDYTFGTIGVTSLYVYDTLENGNILFKSSASNYEGVTYILDIKEYTLEPYAIEIEG